MNGAVCMVRQSMLQPHHTLQCVLSVLLSMTTVPPPPRLPSKTLYLPAKPVTQSQFNKEWMRWSKFTERPECLDYWETLGWYYKHRSIQEYTAARLTRREQEDLRDFIDDPEWRIIMQRLGFYFRA